MNLISFLVQEYREKILHKPQNEVTSNFVTVLKFLDNSMAQKKPLKIVKINIFSRESKP